jgi:hypothetical protein
MRQFRIATGLRLVHNFVRQPKTFAFQNASSKRRAEAAHRALPRGSPLLVQYEPNMSKTSRRDFLRAAAQAAGVATAMGVVPAGIRKALAIPAYDATRSIEMSNTSSS